MLIVLLLAVTVFSVGGKDLNSQSLDPEWYGVMESSLSSISRTKRLTAGEQNQDNTILQKCTLPDGKNGICRPLRHCIQDEWRNDFIKILEHACVLNSMSIGTCCPEAEKRGGIQGLAGDLPAVVQQDEKLALKITSGSRGCGLSTRSQSTLNSEGTVQPREYPWTVCILRPKAWPRLHCGGSLVTERHVLTAAHCVDDSYDPKDFIVRLGEYDLKRMNDTRSVSFDVLEVRIHEEYQSTNYKNDIAVLKLQSSCLFNTYVWPICLPPSNLDLTGKEATLVGWGTTDLGGKTSPVLREVAVPVWELDACIKSHVNTVFEENICAGAFRKDACQLDSGGPLMYQSASGRWMLVGVVSWGMRCGEPDHPGIYTRVDKYVDWIERHTGL